MEAVLPADGADFPLRKKTGRWDWPKGLLKAGCVVVWFGEKPTATAVTGEHETALGSATPLSVKQLLKIISRGVGVPEMKLNRLPGSNLVTDRHNPCFRIRAEHITHQEIALLELILVFTRHPAKVK